MGKDADYSSVEEYKKMQMELEQTNLKKTLILDLYKEVNRFQEELNRFLGQTVQYVFVEQDDAGNPIMFKVREEDMLTADEASKGAGLVARFSKKASTLLKDSEGAVEKIEFLESQVENINVLQRIYRSVIFKINTYKVTGPNGKETSLILWHNPSPPPPWGKMLMNNRGDVGEAYAAAALRPEILSHFTQYNAETYDEFMHLIADVDNISGLFQGDVRDGQMEYAIKSVGASALGVKQFVRLAKKIQNAKLFDTKALIKEQYLLAKRGKVRNHIDYVEEVALESIDVLLKEYQV